MTNGQRWLVGLICMLLSMPTLLAQPGTIVDPAYDSGLVKDLSGYSWKMKMMRPGEGVKQGLHKLYPEDLETHTWNPAQVPGDVYTDLWKCGVIEDPYFGRNSVKCQWVQQNEWWYTRKFNLTQPIKDKRSYLYFNGVDATCDVWINGHFLGTHRGAFEPFSFDVTDYLRIDKSRRRGANMVVVRLAPAQHINSIAAGYKTPWFGDYWRDLIPIGIHQGVALKTTGTTRVNDVFFRTKDISTKTAKVDFEYTLENLTSSPQQVVVDCDIKGYNFKSKKPIRIQERKTLAPGKHTFVAHLNIKDAQLWWPWDLGKPNLYVANVKVKRNNTSQDDYTTTFGIREVTAEWNPGFTKDEVSFPRTTLINGKHHFIRSACWGGPPNIFVGRTAPGTYEKLIKMAKEANMNNIRIFGWHPPENDVFYRMCDELGLTVWQDVIPLGTGNIQENKETTDRIIKTAMNVMRDRRNHPSWVLMEGGEELFLRTRNPMFARNFLEELGDSLRSVNPLPYVPDSPLTCEASKEAGYKNKEAHHALAYFYGMGNWLMEDWYRRLYYPIIPEFAITSVPNVESLRKFIPEDELWTPGLSWGHHWADLDRLRMQNYDTFGEERTKSLEDFVEGTQQSQGIIFKNGVEFFRRQKPNLSGISLCHFITYCPDMKWGIVDAYQQPKRSFYYVQKAYQPTLVSLDFTRRRWHKNETFKGDIWVVNDLYTKYKNCEVLWTAKNDKGQVLASGSKKIGSVKEDSAKKFFSIEVKGLNKTDKKFTVHLTLKNKEVISENDYMFLIGDQKKASAHMKAMQKEMMGRVREYTYGNYLRFFPSMVNQDGANRESDMQTPRAVGFPQK